MAITNATRAVTIDTATKYLNLPITAGISRNGYWYVYEPANLNNTALLAKIIPYRWSGTLPLAGGASSMVMDGTIPLISETWSGSTVKYHGSCIEWIGPGKNDITNATEDDAFFFGHIGSTTTSPSDDNFYWDRAYDPETGSDWAYYQYHLHSPTFYPTWENGRQTIGANGWIDASDKAYGYMISTRIKVSGVTYASVMARIHTPSVGGAHNSHNDITLPAVSNKSYMPGGIMRGIGERFHCFYMTASGSQWEVFNRTYADASTSFTFEVSLGIYDLADPSFNIGSNQQSQYPIRAGCGTSFGSRIYFPVILNNSISGFDLEIWSLNSLDTISGGSLTRHVLLSGVTARPDCYITNFGTTAIYIIASDIAAGGTKVWSYDGTTWTTVGSFLTNNSANPIRVHGFEFNTEDFKFYALLSGTADGAGTYLGPGLYTFQLDTAFTGYKHLDYDYSTNSFVLRDPLALGYLKYDQLQGDFTRYATAEPQSIAAKTNILKYDYPINQWFNRKQVGFGGKDYYYQTITLKDGRRFGVGRITDNAGNRGIPESGDFLVSIFSPDLTKELHFAAGTPGDDYLTGVWQSQTDAKVWMTGYCKGIVVPKGEVWIHGWCRNLSDGGSALEWSDIAINSDGDFYCVGSHIDGWMVVAKYDKNYNLLWHKRLGDNTSLSDIGKGITVDSSGNIYICGSTEEVGSGSVEALLIKLNSSGTVLWAKAYGNISPNSANSICIVKKGSTEYLVMAVVTASDTAFVVTDTSGTIIEQNLLTNVVIYKVRPNQSTPTSGRFLFAGMNETTHGRFGMCEIAASNGKMVQWIESLTSANTTTLYDIANTDAAVVGVGAGYAICGNDGTNGLVFKVTVDETEGNYTVTSAWQKNYQNSIFKAMVVSPYTDSTKHIYALGSTDNSEIPSMGMNDCLMTTWATSDGTLEYQNAFGHDMNEEWVAAVFDYHSRNIIAAGWSESHSDSRDAIFFRYDKNGFGTGVYNLTETGTSPYYYLKTGFSATTNTAILGVVSATSDSSSNYTTTAYTPFIENGDYVSRDFDGPIGTQGLFTMIIAFLDLNLLQTWLNGDTYKEAVARGDKVIYFDDVSAIGGFYQLATVGDGTADDGNVFGYDIIEHSNGKIYAIGQTSGDITMTNLGLSGAYDYVLIELDPATGAIDFYQNGTNLDEETYALTELANGKIAYVGRTTGELGAANEGGYDIFLGIFDPTTGTSNYYSIGSGLDDAGLNVHDLGSNELAVVYFSYGSLTGTTNYGSQDIGVIKFNYSTNTWGTAWQIGSNTSEIYMQNGKPSALISNDRIAITTSTVGIFGDNAQTYGYLDLCVAILDFTTGKWVKNQVGTTSNEISSSLSAFGDTLLIGGNQEGSFTDDVDAIFVEYDALSGLVGISKSI